ncbi:acyl carrier protein [Saccharopolyspora sp. NPDC050389]|uniref:acyl carrier protein n=1 Tax=Saccharopolyspora sp. NPDC050389 TaxID=3155516 RepID=UPI0033C0543F
MTAVDSVRSNLLDCMQANLAVLADRHHGPGTHLNLGAALRFRWRAEQLPTVEPTLEQHLADAETLLGLRVTDERTVTGEILTAAVQPGAQAYVIADAYELPWVPYFRQRHMEHSFLLSAEGTVVDAYANDTQWGPATPGSWQFPDLRLAGAAQILHFAPEAAPNPVAAVDDGDFEEYLAAYQSYPNRVSALDRLTLETWLLARSRKLHAAFRRHRGLPLRAALDEHLSRWDGLVEQTYLAYRRVARGRPEPTIVVERFREALAADRDVFELGDEGWRRSVAGVVASVLDVAEQQLLGGVSFTSLPRFSSFRLVEIVERLESELGADIDAADLLPENLHRLDDLCQVIRPPAAVPTEGVLP